MFFSAFLYWDLLYSALMYLLLFSSEKYFHVFFSNRIHYAQRYNINLNKIATFKKALWLVKRVYYNSTKGATCVIRVHYICTQPTSVSSGFVCCKIAMCWLFIKEITKRLFPRALLSYISTWEFWTFDQCEEHSPTAGASLSTSLVFLKIRAWLCNSTMHSARF